MLSEISSRFGLWSTYRLDPISLAVWHKKDISENTVSHSHFTQPLAPLLQFLPVAISRKQSLCLPSPCLLSFKNSRFIFCCCSILHNSFYITLPSLCCHPASLLLSGSLSFLRLLIFHPRRDSCVVWCQKRKRALIFCSTGQDENPHNAHLTAERVDWTCAGPWLWVLQIVLPGSWGIVSLVFWSCTCTAQWKAICFTLRVDMNPASTFERNILIVMA